MLPNELEAKRSVLSLSVELLVVENGIASTLVGLAIS
jgi:hypothetical protein